MHNRWSLQIHKRPKRTRVRIYNLAWVLLLLRRSHSILATARKGALMILADGVDAEGTSISDTRVAEEVYLPNGLSWMMIITGTAK